MAQGNEVNLTISSCCNDSLVAYGGVLRFGQHHKVISLCYPAETHSKNYVQMEGTIAGLKMVTRPCNITITSCNANELHNNLKSTPFQHLRGEFFRLEEIHSLRWESLPNDSDVALAFTTAEKSINEYKLAEELVDPGLDFIRRAMEVFCVGPESRINVSKWVKTSEEGTDEWTVPVEILVVR